MEKFAENLDGLITHLEDSLNKNTVGMNIELILVVMNTTELIVEIRPEQSSGPYGMRTHDLCDTGAVLYQLG